MQWGSRGYAGSANKSNGIASRPGSKNLGLFGIVPSFSALLIPELAKTLASCVPPGHRISTSINLPDESQTACAFNVYFIL
jgi:hypothetical protein